MAPAPGGPRADEVMLPCRQRLMDPSRDRTRAEIGARDKGVSASQRRRYFTENLDFARMEKIVTESAMREEILKAVGPGRIELEELYGEFKPLLPFTVGRSDVSQILLNLVGSGELDAWFDPIKRVTYLRRPSVLDKLAEIE